jgi:hypothetical protein
MASCFRCSEQDSGDWLLDFVPPRQRRSAPIRPIADSPIRRFASLRDKSSVAGQTTDNQAPASCGISFEFKPSLFFAKEWRRRANYPNLRQQSRGRSS